MYRKIDRTVAAQVMAVLPLLKTPTKVHRHLESIGVLVSLSTVKRVVKEDGERYAGVLNKPRKPPKHMTPYDRTKRLIAKVEKLIDDENPPTQDRMAKDSRVTRRNSSKHLEAQH